MFFLPFLPSLALASGEVLVAVGSYQAYALHRAIEAHPRYSSMFRLVTEKDPRGELLKGAKGARVVVVDIMLSSLGKPLLEMAAKGELKGKRVYCVSSSTDDTPYYRAGFIFDEAVRTYYANPVEQNMISLVGYILAREFKVPAPFSPPILLPSMGIYHPRAPKFFTRSEDYLAWHKTLGVGVEYWVGMLFFPSYLTTGNKGVLDEIIRRFEAHGLGVIPAFGKYPADKAAVLFLDGRGKPRVDLVVTFCSKMSASLKQETWRILERLNVPVINLIELFSSDVKAWKESPLGLAPVEVSWQVAMPEFSGVIEPTVVSGQKPGDPYRRFVAIPGELDFLIARVRAWLRLRHKPNGEKRIAIIYYNHHPGKQNVGASYLNVFASTVEILKALKEAGYRVEGKVTKWEIRRLILLSGRNVGSWAPGELERMVKEEDVVKVPLSLYLRWYRRLPLAFRTGVEKDWDKPQNASIMTWNGSIILPAIRLGNVILMPQPSRGWGSDAWKLYHSTTLYPHHQYVAFYLWLRYGFHADAVVHLGTHGTLEWLPGKQVGLDRDSPPAVLIQDLPDIYPYIMDDVGEGIQAKRRGWAMVVDHLIPPLLSSGLYGGYRRLSALISDYEGRAAGEQVKELALKRIWREVKALGIDRDLGLSGPSPAAIERVEHYLREIQEDRVPYGLHTFGVSPRGKALDAFADALGGGTRVRRALEASGAREMRNLLRALEGHFIPPGPGNDPLRTPEAIPTGKNFYGFDPRKIPSKEAWTLGVRLVREMLNGYLRKEGKYPRKVAIVLWATETVRNQGVNEAQILYLLGMRPKWDRADRVVGLDVIPGRSLGRPRIDVVVNASGLYRDMFPQMLLLLDGAVRRAALLRDVENFVALNARLLERALLREGMDEARARKLSLTRVFSEEPGSYGPGVSEMTANTGYWKDSMDVARVFVNRTGFAFGQGMWGARAQGIYRRNLGMVDVALHSISSNVYRALDNDDVFGYLGGLALAVKKERGRFPEVKVVRSTGKRAWVEGISKTLGQEMAARYFNPKWIRGMMKEGYAGAREMSKFVEYLWGWQVTAPFAVSQVKWMEAFRVYVKDRYRLGLREFFDRYNPWAYQAMVGWMLEAIRKGYWKAPEKVKLALAREYAVSVVQKGVACCEHTCNNPFLHQFVANLLSIPGALSPQVTARFKKAVERATGRSLERGVKERIGLMKRLARSLKAKIIKGMELKEEEKKEPAPSSSGVSWFLLLLSFIMALMVVVGMRSQIRHTYDQSSIRSRRSSP